MQTLPIKRSLVQYTYNIPALQSPFICDFQPITRPEDVARTPF